MQDFRDVIQQLRSIDLNDDSNTENIRRLLYQLHLPLVRIKANAGSLVIRARRGRGYKEKKDMNYKPSSLCKTYQRASLPNQTVFYGILSDDDSHLENARAIGISECSVLADKGIDSVGREYIANSQWLITENIDIACIISANSYKDVHDNKLLERLRKDFIDVFSNSDMALYISNYIEGEFSKRVPSGHDNDYKISATLTDMLLNDFGFEAVAYPPVKLGGQAGLNLAIRPDVADSKLKLQNIADQCFYKNAKHSILRIESIYDVVKKRTYPAHQMSDSELCNQIYIHSIDDLPLIN